MREYLFRGKSVGDLAPWIYGYYHFDKTLNAHYICDKDSLVRYEVRPETVGQLVHKDRNEHDIFHGDILQMYSHSDITHRHEKGLVWIGDGYEPDVREVKYQNGTFYTIGFAGIEQAFMHTARPGQSYEVIGNVHDNPELLLPLNEERILPPNN